MSPTDALWLAILQSLTPRPTAKALQAGGFPPHLIAAFLRP